MHDQHLTFLFTDIVGSSRLWEQHPDAMRTALAQHDTVLHTAIAAHQGTVVKTTGDGCHAMFQSASRAVLAALDAQRALQQAAWPAGLGKLKVRMGLHTGESEARDGDYYGPSVNRAARIMGVAHGGQVVLSAVTAALVQANRLAPATLLDLGSHHLRDLEQPVQLFQLQHPDLPDVFPPLNSLSSAQHNLPLQATIFIGREREMADVRHLLADHRLVTLLGPGGTGKTRLALQTAANLVADFDDGVWLAELAPLADPALLVERVAAIFNLREQSGTPLHDTLTAYLQRKHVLLLLDNVEHLVREAADLAAHLLAHCPNMRLLVTGREALNHHGEVTYQLPSLSLPDSDDDLARINNAEAVQLFLARAREYRPDFTLISDNAAAVVNIARRLDGIPLALELAAARLRVMTAEQVATHLDDRFRLLTGGRRTVLPRQQTLQALIDWSWNLLSDDERILMQRLAVFVGGFDLAAVQAIATDNHLSKFDTIDLLDQLIGKSMVVANRTAGGEMRYHLLESIHQYARDHLFAAGEGENLRERHADYYTAFGERVSDGVAGPDMMLWVNQLMADYDNLLAAREWALDNRLDLALRMARYSTIVIRYSFMSHDGRRWLGEVARKARAAYDAGGDISEADLAYALSTHGTAELTAGNGAIARPVLEEAVVLAERSGAVECLSTATNMLVVILLNHAEYERADALSHKMLALAEEHDLPEIRMMALGSFTPLYAFRGDPEKAKAYADEGIRLMRQHGNPWAMALAHMLKGRVDSANDNLASAVDSYKQAAALFDTIRDDYFRIVCLSEIGHLQRRMDDLAAAEQTYRETIVAFQEFGHRSAVAHQLECFGLLAAATGHPDRALRLLTAADVLRQRAESTRMPHEQADFDIIVPQLAARLGDDATAAARRAGQALTLDEAVEFALAKTVAG